MPLQQQPTMDNNSYSGGGGGVGGTGGGEATEWRGTKVEAFGGRRVQWEGQGMRD